MPVPTYVLGHKNPDSDSICSAVGYATFAHLQGQPDVIAARQGMPRRETSYILDRFGIAPPLLLTDVRPRVADVMTTPGISVRQDASLYSVGQLIQGRGFRLVPVVDDTGQLQGVTGVEDFANVFLEGLDLGQMDYVPLLLENVVETLGAKVLVAASERTLADRVMVGAMEIDSMLQRISPNILLVMGDREDAQRAAIEYGIGALVITGNHPVSPHIIELARQHRVTVMTVPHHTYTTVRLIVMSMPVRHIMRTDAPTCHPDDFVDDVRDLMQRAMRAIVVVNDDGTVAGLLSRTNLLKTVRRRVVLVDHNEHDQAVAGIEEAEIVGVIDHHRVANFQTRTPPFMRFEPVGATSTIVAKLFLESQIDIPREISGVLLGGILADTLLFRGPTTTPDDQRVAELLAERAEVEIEEFGQRIMRLASDVSDRSAEQLVSGDFKDFTVEGMQIGIGVIETTNRADVLARRDELLQQMNRVCDQGYTTVLFAVIDIVDELTTILVVGHPEATAKAFNTTLLDRHTIELPGILSRKKHLVPQLGTLARLIKAR